MAPMSPFASLDEIKALVSQSYSLQVVIFTVNRAREAVGLPKLASMAIARVYEAAERQLMQEARLESEKIKLAAARHARLNEDHEAMQVALKVLGDRAECSNGRFRLKIDGISTTVTAWRIIEAANEKLNQNEKILWGMRSDGTHGPISPKTAPGGSEPHAPSLPSLQPPEDTQRPGNRLHGASNGRPEKKSRQSGRGAQKETQSGPV